MPPNNMWEGGGWGDGGSAAHRKLNVREAFITTASQKKERGSEERMKAII